MGKEGGQNVWRKVETPQLQASGVIRSPLLNTAELVDVNSSSKTQMRAISVFNICRH